MIFGTAKNVITNPKKTKRIAWPLRKLGKKTMKNNAENDDQKLDVVTDAFIRAMLVNKMDNRKSYFKLLRRIAMLIRVELNWSKRKAWEKQMMQAWGSSVN